MAVPGRIAPRSGDHWPQTWVWPARPLRLDDVDEPQAGGVDLAHAVAEGAVVLDVGGRAVVGVLDVGRAVEVRHGRGQPVRAGVVGERPPRRVRRGEHPAPAGPHDARDLAHEPRAVGDELDRAERGERVVERSRRGRAGARRRPAPAARRDRCVPRRRARGAACRPRGRTRPGRRPAPTSQREHIAAPQPTSSTRRPRTSPSRCASLSRRFSGHHTKSASPRKAPCSPW